MFREMQCERWDRSKNNALLVPSIHHWWLHYHCDSLIHCPCVLCTVRSQANTRTKNLLRTTGVIADIESFYNETNTDATTATVESAITNATKKPDGLFSGGSFSGMYWTLSSSWILLAFNPQQSKMVAHGIQMSIYCISFRDTLLSFSPVLLYADW